MATTSRPTPGRTRPRPTPAADPPPVSVPAPPAMPRVRVHPDDGTDHRSLRERAWPAARYVAPDPRPMTGVRRAKALAGPGVLITVVGLALLAIGITIVVPIVILVIGVGDLLAAAVLALKDPYVKPERHEE